VALTGSGFISIEEIAVVSNTLMDETLQSDRFQSLLDKLPAGAYTCEPGGMITYYNQQAARLWGRAPKLLDPADRFCGSFRLYATDGEPIPHNRCWMALALSENKEFNGREIIIEREDGRRINALAHANPLHGENGRLLGGVNVLVDISGQRWAERERHRFTARVQHAQKLESLGSLAGGVAHVFNNLMTAVVGYAALALAELPAGSRAHGMVTEIDAAARRASDLSRQMLAYSGRGRFLSQNLRLDSLLQDMLKLFELFVARRAVLRLELNPVSIDGDAAQIRQILWNLVTNAADAMNGQRGVINLRTAIRPVDAAFLASTVSPEGLEPGDYAVLEVEDNGQGMSEETILRIFDPFFTTKLTGRGMGLAAVLAIVKGHRGTIKVTSAPGQGTLMQVLFPCSHEARVPAAEIARQSQTWKGEGTILVVDEDEAIRTFTRRILTRAGFQVLEAGDGREGSAAFRKHRDQLAAVALDLTTPFLDGVENLHELLRTHASIPVLHLSSHEEPSHLPGAAGFLAKPFAPSDLIKLLRTALPQ